MKKSVIGIDFGTTNSSIACAVSADELRLAQFPYLGDLTEAYRSLLYLEQLKENGANKLKSWTGPEGIERYLSAEPKGRLIQSLKSFLSSRNFHGTEVFGRRYTLEDLIARILRDLREKRSVSLASIFERQSLADQFILSEPRTTKTTPTRNRGCDRRFIQRALNLWNSRWNRWRRLTIMNPRSIMMNLS
jgi:hypothetical protein